MTQPAFVPLPQYKVEVHLYLKREWKWKILHRNGKVVGVSSEGFTSKNECIANLKVLGSILSEYSQANMSKQV